jgi:hypothetical protein
MTDRDMLIELKSLLERDIARFGRENAAGKQGRHLSPYVEGKVDEAERILTWLSHHDRDLFE